MGLFFGEQLENLARRLRQAGADYPRFVADQQEEFMDRVIEPATQAKVPRKTNALANSASVDKSGNRGYEPEISITYGDSEVDGVGVDYAAAVHEILDAEHAAPTGAKYVESPLEESVPALEHKMTRGSKRFLEERL